MTDRPDLPLEILGVPLAYTLLLTGAWTTSILVATGVGGRWRNTTEPRPACR